MEKAGTEGAISFGEEAVVVGLCASWCQAVFLISVLYHLCCQYYIQTAFMIGCAFWSSYFMSLGKESIFWPSGTSLPITPQQWAPVVHSNSCSAFLSDFSPDCMSQRCPSMCSMLHSVCPKVLRRLSELYATWSHEFQDKANSLKQPRESEEI